MPTAAAEMRTHFFRQKAAIRIVTRVRRFDLDADNPVMPQIERQLAIEAIDEGRSVLIQEGNEPDRALLRMPEWEGERSRARVLTPQRFVASFRRLNDLVMQCRQVVFHPAERRLRRALQRRI